MRQISGNEKIAESVEKNVSIVKQYLHLFGDRAGCFHTFKLWHYLAAKLHPEWDVMKNGSNADAPESRLLTLADLVEEIDFFFGAAGTNKSELDGFFGSNKAKSTETMLAVEGHIVTSGNI